MHYTFADFTLDTDAHVLLWAGKPVEIEPQVFDLLHLLVRNAGQLVTRDTMIDAVWGGRIVSESAISARIAAARKAVGDTGKEQAIIQTVHRRGLKFVADLRGAPSPAAANARAQPPIRYAQTPDGVNLAYMVTGHGTPILRVPHFPTHLEQDWNGEIDGPVFEALGRHHKLVLFDAAGTGLSDLDVSAPTMDTRIAEMAAVADAAGIEKFAINGLNNGAMTAVKFAVTYPERVTHLILQSGYAQGRGVRSGADAGVTQDYISQMIQEGWKLPGSPFLMGWIAVYFPDADEAFWRRHAEDMRGYCPSENIDAARNLSALTSVVDLLPHVCVPTLVIHSRRDAVHPLAQGQLLAKGIKGAELVVLETGNYQPLTTEPAWQVQIDAILSFLARDK